MFEIMTMKITKDILPRISAMLGYAVLGLQTLNLLFSCASDEILTDETVPIRMVVSCQPQTRGPSGADSQGSSFDEGAKINVYIVQSDNTVLSNNQTYTANAPSDGKNILTPPDATRPPYYSNGDKTVNIKACYPKTVLNNTTTFTVQLDQTTQSANEDVDTYKLSDLMTASVTGQSKTHEDIVLQFRHHMAKIKVNATATDELTIQSIKLTNVQTTATYNTTDKWEGSGATGTITLAKDGTAATLGGVALFPAQTIEGKTFIQVVTNKGTANYVVTSKDFQEGYEYTANLEVGMQNLTMTAAITSWNIASGSASVAKINRFGMYIEGINESFTYDGNAKYPSVVVKYKKEESEETLEKDRDYTLAYYNNTNAGEALVVAEGMAGTLFVGAAAVQSFTIAQATPSLEFTSAGTITREFAWNDSYTNSLTSGSKYDGVVTWTSSDEAVATVDGTGLVQVLKPGTTIIKMSNDDSGNYETGSAQYTLSVTKRSVKNHVEITSLGEYYTIYNGTEKKPVPVVYDGSIRLEYKEEGGHFTVSYGNNINVGTGTVTITGIGDYYDNSTASKSFPIEKASPTITMETNARTIGIGTTYECNATTDYGVVSYVSSNPSVATVNSSTGVVSALAAGTTTITASVGEGNNYHASTTESNKTITITVQEQKETFSAVGYHSYTCPATATYTFELLGAGGGSYGGARGGYGGWVKASKRLEQGTVVHIYVGGKGTDGNYATGGINGTGESNGGKSGAGGGGSGGAATEIRIGGTAAANRQLVAGGGGGSSGNRRAGKDGGSTSAGNYDSQSGEDVTFFNKSGGGGGGYRGGRQGGFSGAYGGSNYINSSWDAQFNKVSSNASNGSVVVTYQFE